MTTFRHVAQVYEGAKRIALAKTYYQRIIFARGGSPERNEPASARASNNFRLERERAHKRNLLENKKKTIYI